MRLRIIHVSDEGYDFEDVYFMEEEDTDFTSPASDFCLSSNHKCGGQKVITDKVANIDLPPGFPLNRCLRYINE